MMQPVTSYGVRVARQSEDWLDVAAERLDTIGFAVVPSGLSDAALGKLASTFDTMHVRYREKYDERRLKKLSEADLLRCPLADSEEFLTLASNARIMSLCERMLGPNYILNQQNGIVNPAGVTSYSQSPYHRDLPYQHFVSSRPIAINALFCLDDFTEENGATYVIPASHKQEPFPSEAFIRQEARQVSAPKGSFIVLDCMTFHRGGVNTTAMDRRAVNHLFTIAPIRQQIDLPSFLGDSFTSDPDLRRLLGLNQPFARSVEDYLADRERVRAKKL